MAITLVTIPPRFNAAFNQIAYTISSNNTAQPNFNFIIDVKLTGGTLLSRLKFPVQPSSNQLTFDVGPVLQNQVTHDLSNVTAAIIAANTNSRANFYCEFRELYDVAGVPTLSAVLASDPTTPSATSFKVAYNAIFDFEDYSPSAFINTYRINNNGFMNSATVENFIIAPDQYKTLSFFDPDRLVNNVQVLTGAGGTTVLTEAANEYLFNINAATYLISALGLTITDNQYTIKLRTAANVVLATYVIDIDTNCSNYETVRLHWMNKAGCFESFNFRKVFRHNENIERTQFKKPISIGYAKSDRVRSNYNTVIDDVYTLNSDWITDNQATFFEQLLTSPVVYWEKSSTLFVAVNLTNGSYETRKYINDRELFNLQVQMSPSYNRYRQLL